MEMGLLHLHNVLRWVILLLVLITLFYALAKKEIIRSSSLWLMIASHLMLLIGLYQLVAGRFGIIKGLPEGVSLMKDSFYRFYWIEHPIVTIIAVGLITLSRKKAKALNYRATAMLLLAALLCILIAIPWPFRAGGVGRPWFPGT